MEGTLTCSRTFQTLLMSPASRKNRSNIISGVSGPLVSLDLVDMFELDELLR